MNLKKSESTGKKLFTGFFSGNVVAVNPTKEERAAIIGYDLNDDAEDIKYEGKNDKDEEFVDLRFLLKVEGTENQFMDAKFRIVDKNVTSKDGTKTQYVSASGDWCMVDSEANIKANFKNWQKWDKANKKFIDQLDSEGNPVPKTYRLALQGEANLYKFLRAWLSKVDVFNSETNLMFDKERLFRNVNKFVEDEYIPLVKATGDEKLVGSVGTLATVYTQEKEGEVKHYQNLYQEYFPASGYQKMMQKISLACTSGNWTADDKIKKYHEQITGEYGPKDSYELCLLKPFDPDNYQEAGNETFKEEGAVDKPPKDSDY